MPGRATPLDWAAFAALVLLWGSSFVAIKYGLDSIGPYWLAAARLVVAALVVLVVALPMRARWPRGWREWGVATLLGIAGNAIPFSLIGWASLHVPSGTAGLMMATSPTLALGLGVLVLPQEKVTRWALVGFGLGFAGLAIVIAGREAIGFGTTPTGRTLFPYLALLAAASGYAAATIVGRRFSDIPVMTRSIGTLVAGGIATVLLATLFEPLPISISPASALALLYLAVLPTGLATILVLWLLTRTTAGFVAQNNYLVPVAAIGFGALLFGEQLGVLQYAGTLIILIGVAITETLGRPRAAKG